MDPLSIYTGLVNQQINLKFNSNGQGELSYKDLAEAAALQIANKNLSISYPDYEKNYNPKDWELRKLIAIPKAFSSVIKSIYHLIGGVVIAAVGDLQGGKAYAFSSLRDIQESFGWLVELGNDKAGSYLVASASFMNTCYDIQVNHKNNPNNPLLVRQIKKIEQDFSVKLENALQLQGWVPEGESSEINLDVDLSTLGREEKSQKVHASLDKIKEVLIERLFGKPDENGNYPLKPFSDAEPKIMLSIKPTNTQKSSPQPLPIIQLDCVIKSGEDGYYIDNEGQTIGH